jgi:hypothetical protein
MLITSGDILSIKIYITHIKQSIVWGGIEQGNIFFTLLLLKFKISTYLKEVINLIIIFFGIKL